MRRNRSMTMAERIRQVNQFVTGWVTYYALAKCQSLLNRLDEWIRRKLRCIRLKQCKRPWTIAKFLMANGVPEWRAWMVSCSGKGWWRLAYTPQAHEAMSVKWFKQEGLVSLKDRLITLQIKRNRRGTEQVCPVV